MSKNSALILSVKGFLQTNSLSITVMNFIWKEILEYNSVKYYISLSLPFSIVSKVATILLLWGRLILSYSEGLARELKRKNQPTRSVKDIIRATFGLKVVARLNYIQNIKKCPEKCLGSLSFRSLRCRYPPIVSYLRSIVRCTEVLRKVQWITPLQNTTEAL